MKRGWFYITLLILFFVAGIAGCSATRKHVKVEPAAAAPEEAPPPEAPSALAPEKPGETPNKEAQAKAPEKIPEKPLTPPPLEEKAQPAPAPGGPSPSLATIPAVRQPDMNRSTKFVLNFDNADIFEVIRVMGEVLKINYIVDPRVKGSVNIHTSGQISSEDAFPIFQSILRLNGATAVRKGIIYEILPFAEAKKLPTSTVSARRDEDRNLADEKYAIQIISLKYIPAAEVSKAVKPFLTEGADVVEFPLHNILIIGDLSSNIRKTLDLIDLFDVDIFTDMHLRIYPIVNADVTEISKEMERIFASFEVSMKSGRGMGITFTPITRINALLVVSEIPNIFDKVDKWIRELDKVPGEASKLGVFVYYVQNGKAKDLAEVLRQVYTPRRAGVLTGMTTATSPTRAPGPGDLPPQPRSTTPVQSPMGASLTLAPGQTGTLTEGEMSIVVDEATNGLIIRAYHRDYQKILETIKKLDIYPKQVLIEVLLAQVTLNDLTKYGLEFSTFTDSFVKGATTYGYTVGMGGIGAVDPATFASGLRYSVSAANKLAAAINASASEDRLKVISSPHILASNNKEAKIQIGSSQPILTNTYTATGAVATGVVVGTIEYKDIGILLTVTPRISDGRLVTMDIAVEQSSVGTTQLGNLPSVPFFPKKTAKTTLSIMEGQTIVIGGLIEDSKDVGKTGLPFLSRIPVLGALFGYHSYTINKTETLLMMTPHVVENEETSRVVTEEFQEKVKSIIKELGRKKPLYEKEMFKGNNNK